MTATGHEAWIPTPPTKWMSETYILQHGHYQIEVMANLDKVPANGALIVVTWPKVTNGLGFPGPRLCDIAVTSVTVRPATGTICRAAPF